jgi:deoxyribose-phosphate aldolase
LLDRDSISSIPPRTLAEYLDHTLLRPDAKENEIALLCEDALQYDFKGVCVEVKWLKFVVDHLDRSSVLPVTVIAFPKGDNDISVKCEETKKARDLGAKEIDMVLNRFFLKEKNYALVYSDIRSVVETAGGLPVKVILENSELTAQEKIVACGLAKAAGAAFVKTSTGFSSSGAKVEDVRIMREVVGKNMGVKASGGIKSYEDATRMIRAGASRIGTSGSVSIIKEAIQKIREVE